MGARGPAPKRKDQRLGNQTKAEQDAVTKVSAVGPVSWPRVSTKWHPVAQDWYRSLRASGQARFYEPSDVAAARFVAHAMSETLRAETFSASGFSAVWSAMDSLLTTEGARRRVRVEIERTSARAAAAEPAHVPAVTQLDDYRDLYGD